MVISRRFEPPDLVIATLRGVVTPQEQADLIDWIRASIRRVGTARLLVLLEAFGGWHPGESFDRASWLDDDEGVTRIAIVGREEWKAGIMTFIAQPLRRVPIEYFETEAAARAWLGSSVSQSVTASRESV
jgi:stage II sporulation SpoAA-like protein